MAVLTREAILKAQDLPRELVHVPEWGGEVYVRAMTGTERDAFEASMVVEGKNGLKGAHMKLENLRAKLAALTVCDADGQRLFSDKDVEALGQKSAAGLDRVFSVAQRLSGISQKDVEELTKN